MLNRFSHVRAVAIWCMSILTLGAWHIVSGTAITIPNGELLAAMCVVPPLCMFLIWRRPPPPIPATETVLR